jgi:hypothetical protein
MCLNGNGVEISFGSELKCSENKKYRKKNKQGGNNFRVQPVEVCPAVKENGRNESPRNQSIYYAGQRMKA